MNRKNILNILFWIALVVGIVLVLWRIFGDSPSDLSIMITFLLILLFKIWGISDNLNGFKHEVRTSFVKVKSDLKDIGERVEKTEGGKGR